jgi:hypothetical protein
VLVYAVGSTDRKPPWIGRELFDRGEMNRKDALPYMKDWGCPRNLGSLTITAITGKNGVVSFASTAGVSGTLNMATSAWSFSQ